MEAFVDADWASDVIDRKSTSGILILVFGNPILWKTKKQKVVSRTSTHAEFYALADYVAEILSIKGLLKEFDLKFEKPVKIFEDNTGAIAIANNSKFSKNSKHIDVSYHFVYNYVTKGEICMVKIHTQEQIADILTKALSKVLFPKV